MTNKERAASIFNEIGTLGGEPGPNIYDVVERMLDDAERRGAYKQSVENAVFKNALETISKLLANGGHDRTNLCKAVNLANSVLQKAKFNKENND